MTAVRSDAKNSLLCALACVAAVLLTWPQAGMSFNDDWSFAFTVKRLAETGHITYNGWSSPSVIAQSWWGLLWITPFGFSFDALRLSTIPLAAGSTAMAYLLARRAGLIVSASVLVALSLALSPLFLPLATSFMSDVPGLFCILLSVYALVRAVESPSRGRTLAWMIAGIVAAAVGGSSRQIVWIVPLILLPWIGWLRRRDLPLLLAGATGWITTLATALLIQRWFNHQPYSLPEPSITSEIVLSAHHPLKIASQFLSILLTLMMVTLPAGLALLPRLRTSRRLPAAFGPILLLTAAFLFAKPYFVQSPWMGNLITPAGIFGNGQINGVQIVVLGPAVWLGVSFAVYLAVAALLSSAAASLRDWPAALADTRRFFLDPPAAGMAATVALTLVTGGYLSLLLTRCALDFAYDRHLMPLIPCVAILILVLNQTRRGGESPRRVPLPSWIVLGLIGVFAIAGTQQETAQLRARAIAADRLLHAGIPRNKIDAGFEFDAWTELLNSGYTNDSRIANPHGAYRPELNHIPTVKPDYRLETATTPDTVPTPFGSVEYFSALPPFHRVVRIDRFRDGVPMSARMNIR